MSVRGSTTASEQSAAQREWFQISAVGKVQSCVHIFGWRRLQDTADGDTCEALNCLWHDGVKIEAIKKLTYE